MDNVTVYPRLHTLWHDLDRMHDDVTATRQDIIKQLALIIAELAALETLEQ